MLPIATKIIDRSNLALAAFDDVQAVTTTSQWSS